ncbi:glycosyltransferase [Nocardia takedensis]|uniref:glycosyltransferase n=1 Tax=Nocardia takedensis TaxID=259390 RepID=UPI003F75E667
MSPARGVTGDVMRSISVVTAVHQPRPDFLAAAYSSLLAQDMPAGWSWQWVVQLDDDSGGPLPLPVAALADPRVSVGSNRRGGPGVARTVALVRAEGALVRTLDSDDQLTKTALADAITVFERHAEVGWSVGALIDLLPNGERRGFAGDPPEGRLPQGSITAVWCSDPTRLPVHPSTLTVRRELLLAAGGWAALPVSEDMALLLALDALGLGWFHARPGLLRRHHPDQMTADAGFAETVARLRPLLAERAEALRRLYPRRPPVLDQVLDTDRPPENRLAGVAIPVSAGSCVRTILESSVSDRSTGGWERAPYGFVCR